MSSERPRLKPLTPEEVDAIDASMIDSVTGDRLLATIRTLRGWVDSVSGRQNALIHQKVALWCASEQGELAEAAEWFVSDVPLWLDREDIASNPWAHDWRLFWNSRDGHDGTEARSCNICGVPATRWSGTRENGWAACSDRHRLAILGELKDEQCRLCNEVVVCAHDLAGSPVCADCWPGERLLADRRRTWSERFTTPPSGSGSEQP